LSSFLTENTILLTMKTNRLMPFRETVGIDFENHSNHVYYVTYYVFFFATILGLGYVFIEERSSWGADSRSACH